MIFFSLNPFFDFTIYALQVCSLVLLPTYKLHKGFRRNGNNKICLREDVQIPHKRELREWGSKNTTYRGIWECHTKKSLSFIWKLIKPLE
jgi:hypothetical protein